MRNQNSLFTAGLISLAACTSLAHGQVFNIASDTFIDSTSPGSLNTSGQPNGIGGGSPYATYNGQTYDIYSYGADGKVKAVTSNSNSYSDSVNATHVLLSLNTPSTDSHGNTISTFWQTLSSDIAANPSLLTNPNFSVTVSYYPFNDSLNPSDGHGTMQLYPLTHSFTVGSGTQSPMVASTPPSAGATWDTYDGIVGDDWTSPGGDYNSAYTVQDGNTSLPASKGGVPFTWNITSLIENPTAMAELEANGALISVTGEGSFPPTGTYNDFVSFYSADAITQNESGASSAVLPTITITLPEPTCAGMAVLVLAGYNARRRKSN